MIVAGTGHRPSRLGGYDDYARGRLVDLARAALEKHQPDQVISDMAGKSQKVVPFVTGGDGGMGVLGVRTPRRLFP